MNKKGIEAFEKQYKDTIFDKIGEILSKQFKTISSITTNAKILGQSEVSIPNTAITINNKLVELADLFKEKGLSIFSREIEDTDTIAAVFLGEAIIQDLFNKLKESIEKLENYANTIEDVSKKKSERGLALQNESKIKKFFLRIRALFGFVKLDELTLTEEEKDSIDSSLNEYKDIDSEIFNYKLEDNIVEALVKDISGPQKFGEFEIPHRFVASVVPELLEESIIPDLKKLGLEHLIPDLKESLIEEYKKDLPNPEVYQVKDEEMYLYVPDFTRKFNESHEKNEKLYEMKSIIEEKNNGGLGLNTFESMDWGVSADERKEVTEVISKALEQSNDKEITDKPMERDD